LSTPPTGRHVSAPGLGRGEFPLTLPHHGSPAGRGYSTNPWNHLSCRTTPRCDSLQLTQTDSYRATA